MNKSALTGLLIALTLPLLGYFILKNVAADAVVMPRHYGIDSVSSTTRNGKRVEDTIWRKLPEYTYQNQLGKSVQLANLKDKILVIDFFFTHCPTICPRMTTNMKELQDGIANAKRTGKGDADFVHFISMSIDPERDSVERLKAWADRFQIDPANWWLLTGNKKEIYDFSQKDLMLGVIDGKGIDTNFFHTDYVVLVDARRNIRGFYHGLEPASMEKLSRDLVLLHLEKDPGRKRVFEGKLELIAIVFLVIIAGLALLTYLYKKDRKNDSHLTQERQTS